MLKLLCLNLVPVCGSLHGRMSRENCIFFWTKDCIALGLIIV
jgi:hypothetical protein